MIIVPRQPPPTAQARALGKRIAAAVRVLRAEDPSIRPGDVYRGLELAAVELQAELGGGAGMRAVLLSLIAALAFGAWVLWAVLRRGGGEDKLLFYAVTGASIVVVALVLSQLRRR